MEELRSLLAPYRALITYSPLRPEVDASLYLDIEDRATYLIAPRASLDPSAEALAAMEVSGALPTAVLLPGRRFDRVGTRHGQGGGWYDRFLARVPDEWLRIGFCFSDQLSPVPLVRNGWDQPMDYVCAVDRDTRSCTIYASGRLGA